MTNLSNTPIFNNKLFSCICRNENTTGGDDFFINLNEGEIGKIESGIDIKLHDSFYFFF